MAVSPPRIRSILFLPSSHRQCRQCLSLQIRSYGQWIAASSSAQTEVANPLSLEATYVTRSPFRRTDRYPDQSWRYLCFVGTQSFDLADYVAFAGRRRENVEARGGRWEHRCAVDAPIRAQAEGVCADR